jgi:hypothetical protein
MSRFNRRNTLQIRSNSTSNNFNSDRDPTLTDDITKSYDLGSLWMNVLTDKCFICLDTVRNNSIWKIITPEQDPRINSLENRILYLEQVIKDLTGLSK